MSEKTDEPRPEAASRAPKIVWGWAFALFTVAGLFQFAYRHLDHVAREVPIPAIEPFIEQMTGSYAQLVVFIPWVWMVRWFPLGRGTWPRRLPAYLVVMVASSLVHTELMARSRQVLWPLAGLGAYDYGDMSVRYWMEMANDVVWFWVLIGIVTSIHAFLRAQERELAHADLRTALARAEIQSLERRLHPHFLFNALHTISSVMYEDVPAADRMITGLSDLLRRALRSGEAEEVPLREELLFLEHYLSIMRARFEEKLDVSVVFDEDVMSAMVPPLVLQPLVENAIVHGVDPVSNAVRASVTAKRDGGILRLHVRNHGPKQNTVESAGAGVGIDTTARRLSLLYGEAQKLVLAHAEDGGFSVTIEIPFHTRPIREDSDARSSR